MLLSDCVDRYVADRRAKGYARNTIRGAEQCLRELLAAAGNIQMNSIGPRQIDALYTRTADRWAAGTMNKARAHLSSFFKWAQARSYYPRTSDPLEGTRNRKVPPRVRAIIPPAEFETVMDAAQNPRNRAIIALGLFTFARVSEIAAMRWQDVDFDEGRKGTEKWTPTLSIYRQKTKTSDVLPMSEELYYELRKWKLAYGAEVGQVPKPGWYLVPARTSPRFSGVTGHSGTLVPMTESELVPTRPIQDVTRVIRKVLESTGYLAPGEGGHTLRRSGAVAWYNQLSSVGHDRAIRMCQAMLGHSSIATTEVYLRLDLDRKTRNDLLAGKRMFPRADAGDVVRIERDSDGQANAGAVRL